MSVNSIQFMVTQCNQPLHNSVREAIEYFFTKPSNCSQEDLYDLVLQQMEVPLLASVMKFTGENQSRAATILGISRGTLRKKLKAYEIIN